MSRTKKTTHQKETKIEDTPKDTLTFLIPRFAVNKFQLDELKKVCDTQNAKIKELMADMKEYIAGDYKAVRTVRVNEGFNEAALLEVIHNNKKLSKKVIRTQEYVDMDALESAIYNGEVSEEILRQINNCRTRKETVSLSVKKIGGK